MPRYLNSTIGNVMHLMGKKYDKKLLKNYSAYNIKEINNDKFGMIIDYINYDNKTEQIQLSVEDISFMILDHSIDYIHKEYPETKGAKINISVYFNFINRFLVILQMILKIIFQNI